MIKPTEKEFTKEFFDSLGDFVDANKWFVNKLTSQLRKENKQVANL
jgi:hypothetical protein